MICPDVGATRLVSKDPWLSPPTSYKPVDGDDRAFRLLDDTMIPRTIHQIWFQGEKDLEAGSRYLRFQTLWKKHHPGWDYKLWDGQSISMLIRRYHPEFHELYYGPEARKHHGLSVDLEPEDPKVQTVGAVRDLRLWQLFGLPADKEYSRNALFLNPTQTPVPPWATKLHYLG